MRELHAKRVRFSHVPRGGGRTGGRNKGGGERGAAGGLSLALPPAQAVATTGARKNSACPRQAAAKTSRTMKRRLFMVPRAHTRPPPRPGWKDEGGWGGIEEARAEEHWGGVNEA